MRMNVLISERYSDEHLVAIIRYSKTTQIMNERLNVDVRIDVQPLPWKRLQMMRMTVLRIYHPAALTCCLKKKWNPRTKVLHPHRCWPTGRLWRSYLNSVDHVHQLGLYKMFVTACLMIHTVDI